MKVTKATLWLLLAVLCSGLSAYFYFYPPTFNRPHPSSWGPPQTQDQPPAPIVQVQAPPPPPVVYESKVIRRDNNHFEVILGKTQDWYDTGVPTIVDQTTEIGQFDEFTARFSTKLGEEVRFEQEHRWVIYSTPCFFIGGSGGTNYSSSFLDTIKLKLLGDNIPVIHLKIYVRDENQPTCTWAGNLYPDHCNGYSSNRQIAAAQAQALIETIRLE